MELEVALLYLLVCVDDRQPRVPRSPRDFQKNVSDCSQASPVT